MNDIVIDEALIQSAAENTEEQPLDKELLEKVSELIHDNLDQFIREQVNDVLEFEDLLQRNVDAKKSSPHFTVLWRNLNAYQNNFTEQVSLNNLDDAKEYARHEYGNLDDEYLIVRNVEGEKPTEVGGQVRI